MDSLTPPPRLDCEEVVRSLWEYLDGRTSARHAGGIEEHLARCEGCRSHFEFEAKLIRTLAGLRRQHSDPARLRNAVLAVLRIAGVGGPGAA